MKSLKILLVGFALFLVSSAYANPLAGISPVTAPEDDFIIAPIGAAEFNPSTPNNYGLAISEAFAFAKLMPGPDSNHVAVSPYFFVGPFICANIGQWVSTNGNSPWSLDYGLMVGLPKLDETLPEVAFSATWNSITGGPAKLTIDVAFPVDILNNILVHKL